MNERFRFNCAHILVLAILFHSFAAYCCTEFVKDISSNDFIEDQNRNLDTSIEQIFRPSGKINAVTSKDHLVPSNELPLESKDAHIRVKRDNAKRNVPKVSKESSKLQEKRSVSPKSSKSSLRSGRSSREQPKVKQSSDYEASVDQDRSEYMDEVEDDPAISSGSKETGYKASEFHVGEDSDRFIDQEERSSLYDDFEAKDVAKRGISGAEDYEELEEDSAGAAEDTAALDEQESSDEEVEKRKIHGDSRVKREHESAKDVSSKDEASALPPGDSKDTETSLKREGDEVRAAEDQSGKVDKDSSNLGEQSKRNIADKSETESKVSSDQQIDRSKPQTLVNDQVASNENAKLVNEQGPAIAIDRKAEEDVNVVVDKKTPVESTCLETVSRVDEPKIVEVSSPQVIKEVLVNAAENAPAEDPIKLDNSKNLEDGEYEKHVEEQIQRKIDSIKEEIKREIAEKQKIREIETNNAKFDELRDEEDDEEQALEAEVSGNQASLGKRSVKNPSKSQTHSNAKKRSIRRKKRQNELESNVDKKTGKQMKKRYNKVKDAGSISPKKREYARQVFLVRNDRNVGKKKRRRRSKNSMLIPEQGPIKLEDNSAADLTLDSSLHGDLGSIKQSKVTEDEKALAEQSPLAERKSGSVASLTGSSEELGPLATAYGEAFGGLHGEPGVALARFKRIKRVLAPSASKT